MDADPSVGSPYDVRGFPTIKIFGTNKNKPVDYNGARTAQAIIDSAMSNLKTMVNERLNGKSSSSSSGGSSSSGSDSKDVIELTDSNFESTVLASDEPFLVEFFGMCFLFSKLSFTVNYFYYLI